MPMTSSRRYETLELVPNVTSRFSTVALGADRARQIREEFTELVTLAAQVLDVAPAAVTRDGVAAFLARKG
jgi:DNA-directed RNA polymerase subunit K/omega